MGITNIDAGWLTTPVNAIATPNGGYKLTLASEVYKLLVDVTCPLTAFISAANAQTIDLNGHTITYGNIAPITMPNGGFEQSLVSTTVTTGANSAIQHIGTTTGLSAGDLIYFATAAVNGKILTVDSGVQVTLTASVSTTTSESAKCLPGGWDISGCAALITSVAAIRGMWGNTMLEFSGVTTSQVLISPPITLPTGNREYCAVFTGKSRDPASAWTTDPNGFRLALIDAVTGAQLNDGINTAVVVTQGSSFFGGGYAAKMFWSEGASPRTVKVKVTMSVAAGQTGKADVDYCVVSYSRDWGIHCSGTTANASNYGAGNVPYQIASLTNYNLGRNFSLKDTSLTLATATITFAAGVGTINLTGGGAGYQRAPAVWCPGTSTMAATVTKPCQLTAIVAGGAVTGITVVSSGAGYPDGTYTLSFAGGGGQLVMGGSSGYQQHCIMSQSNTTITVDKADMTCGSPIDGSHLGGGTGGGGGTDCIGIYMSSGGGSNITNTRFRSKIDRISNRKLVWSTLMWTSVGANTYTVTDCSLEAYQGYGIAMLAVNSTTFPTPVIKRNQFLPDARVADPYAMGLQGVQNGDIAGNIIIASPAGRGVIFDCINSLKSKTCHCYNNLIWSYEKPNLEYGPTSIEATALRLRNFNTTGGLIDCEFDHNLLRAECDINGTHDCYGVRITAIGIVFQGVNIHDNTIQGFVATADTGYEAHAFSYSRIDPGSVIAVSANLIESNHVSILVGDSDNYGAAAQDALFVSNTVKKTQTGTILNGSAIDATRNHFGITVGDYNLGVHTSAAYGTLTAGGATYVPSHFESTGYAGAPNSAVSITIAPGREFASGCVLTLTVRDQLTNAVIPGATVSITDAAIAVVFTGMTDAAGQVKPTLKAHTYTQTSAGGAPTTASNTPHNISVAAMGYVTSAVNTVTAGDGQQALTIALSGGTAPPQPVVAGLSPATGTMDGGTSVLITGTGFLNALNVQFGGVNALSFVVDSDSQIRAFSPAGPPGIVDVRVTGAAGISDIAVADQFTYFLPLPAVTGIAPNTGTIFGGTPVVITGTGFVSVLEVRFGGNLSLGVAVDSPTQIHATAPAGFGMVDITVKTSGGTSPVTPADQFTYLPGPITTGFLVIMTPSGNLVFKLG